MGRGRVRLRYGGNRHGQQRTSSKMLFFSNGRLPFDLIFFEDIFPSVTPAPATDDIQLTSALLKRNTELTPSTDEIQTTQNLVTRVQGILETLILTPGTFEACQVDEVRQVGSFKQGTILAGHKTADFVVILKTLPTREAIGALSSKVADELRQTECIRSTVNHRGFDLSNVQATIRVLITTVPQNFRKLDPLIHLEPKLMTEHWQAIRHSRWFEENVHNSTIKVLIRILRDLRLRYAEFLPLSTWMLDLLAHMAVMNSPERQPLPINAAFRRTLSLMSGGMYLPGYSGIARRGHNLTYEEEDVATGLAQNLIRILANGGYKVILGLETEKQSGILMPPVEKVYEKPADGEVENIEDDNAEEEEEEEDGEDAPMEPKHCLIERI